MIESYVLKVHHLILSSLYSMASSTSRSEVDDDRWFFGKITGEEAIGILLKG